MRLVLAGYATSVTSAMAVGFYRASSPEAGDATGEWLAYFGIPASRFSFGFVQQDDDAGV